MPPTGSLQAADIDTVKRWIAAGAMDGSTSTTRTTVSLSDFYNEAANDLTQNVSAGDQTYIRYVSTTHLYNAGEPQSLLDAAAAGVSKLMNGLSSASTLKAATAIDPQKTIYRIDLRDYGWDSARWETLITSYPYLIVPQDQKGLAALQGATGTTVPVIRADWLFFNGARAPLYYRLQQAPDDLPTLQKQLGLDFSEDILTEGVIRSGFNNSAVSPQNRVIERHAASLGPVWRSYEFATGTGQKDVLTHPLGPTITTLPAEADATDGAGGGGQADPANGLAAVLGAAAQGDPGTASGKAGAQANGTTTGTGSGTGPADPGTVLPDFSGNFAFDEDGGEFIYPLPNGMLGFFLAGKQGQRLDAVPVTSGSPTILAGYTCMSCHAKGFIPKKDMVRDAAAADPSFASVLDVINALYVDPTTFSTQVGQDTTAYNAVLTHLGVDQGLNDPVYQVGQVFAADLSSAQAAAELGVDEAAFLKIVGNDSSFSNLATELAGGTVARQDFETAFPALVAALKP